MRWLDLVIVKYNAKGERRDKFVKVANYLTPFCITFLCILPTDILL